MMTSSGPSLRIPEALQRDAEHYARPRDDIRALIPTDKLRLPGVAGPLESRRQPPLLFAMGMDGAGPHASEPLGAVVYRRMLANIDGVGAAPSDLGAAPAACAVAGGPPMQRGPRHRPAAHFAEGVGLDSSPSRGPATTMVTGGGVLRALAPLMASPTVGANASSPLGVTVMGDTGSPNNNGQQLDQAARRSRTRLMQSLENTATHSPAQFMTEITIFVENQLAELDRVCPAPTLEQKQQQQQQPVGSTTQEDRRRAMRINVFLRAQAMFADAFKTYRGFLEALADENTSYTKYLQERMARMKEAADAERNVSRAALNAARTAVETAERCRAEATETLQAERDRLKRHRLQQQEQVQKEKARENDAHRQLFELENKLLKTQEELKASRHECESLRSENNRLSIQTFSDQLQTLGMQVADWRHQFAQKEETLHQAHDETAELMKDLRRVCAYFHSMLEYEDHLEPEKLKLSPLGFRALFPEAAKKKRRALAEGGGPATVLSPTSPAPATATPQPQVSAPETQHLPLATSTSTKDLGVSSPSVLPAVAVVVDLTPLLAPPSTRGAETGGGLTPIGAPVDGAPLSNGLRRWSSIEHST